MFNGFSMNNRLHDVNACIPMLCLILAPILLVESFVYRLIACFCVVHGIQLGLHKVYAFMYAFMMQSVGYSYLRLLSSVHYIRLQLNTYFSSLIHRLLIKLYAHSSYKSNDVCTQNTINQS